MIVLHSASSDRVELCSHRRARPVLLSGIGFGAMAAVPLLAGPPLSSVRLLIAASFVVAAVLLMVQGWPRRELIVIDLRVGTYTRRQTVVSLAFAQCIRLTGGSRTARTAARTRYRAELVLGDGRTQPLLERSEPAGVLRDLIELLRHLSVPVKPGWGLPQTAQPWEDGSADAQPALPSFEIVGPLRASQNPAALSTGIGGALVGLIIALMLADRLRDGLQISALSLILPGAGLLFLAALSACLVTARLCVRSSGDLHFEQRVLGLRVRAQHVPGAKLRAAWAVHPDSESRAHLLLDTLDGPVSVPISRETAQAVARELGRPGA